MFHKKGIISLNLFVLLLLLFLILLAFGFYYSNFIQDRHQEDISRLEVIQSGISFRSFIVEVISLENQSLMYEFPYDHPEIFLQLNQTSIIVEKQTDSTRYVENFYTYGIPFCSSYEISPQYETRFVFNGTCILLS